MPVRRLGEGSDPSNQLSHSSPAGGVNGEGAAHVETGVGVPRVLSFNLPVIDGGLYRTGTTRRQFPGVDQLLTWVGADGGIGRHQIRRLYTGRAQGQETKTTRR